MKSALLKKYNYFVLAWFTLTGMFNGISIYFVGSSKKIILDTIFILGLIFLNKRLQKFSIKEILFISFYLFMTNLSLILYFEKNHYGFTKLFNNSILSIICFSNFYLLYKLFKNEFFTKSISFLFKLQVFIEIGFFIYFVLYNKNNGLFGKSIIQIFLLQDFSGRFQGSFSEPSCLGLWLGAAIFIIFLLYRKFFSYLIGFIFIFALYNSCKAKFALIAFPISIIISVIFYKIKYFSTYRNDIIKLKFDYHIFLLFFFICIFSFYWHQLTFSFYCFIANVFEKEGSGTYVTRFGFLLSSIKDICIYPLGHGIGMNYEAFQSVVTDIIPIANNAGLDTFELRGYKIDPNNMGSKETFSMLASTFGFLGIYLYFMFFKNLLSNHYCHKFLSFSLIAFIFFETLITGNIISDSAFFILIFSKMALNTDRRHDK